MTRPAAPPRSSTAPDRAGQPGKPIRVDDPRGPALPRSHSIRWVALSIAAAVMILGVVLALVLGTDPVAERSRSQLLGKAAPSFDLPTLDGTRVSSGALAGKAGIVNFWNTRCIPCRQEHPALVEFYRRHANDPDFAMVGIVRDDNKTAVRGYVAANGVGWIVAFDPGATAALGFGTRGQPETFAISPDGIIAGAMIGPSTVAMLEQMLAAARGAR